MVSSAWKSTRKGSDINIKGNTPGGKFVEWLRTSLGLRKEENQRTFETFVTALKSQYGGDITSIAETGLRESLENGVKPLSGRVCKQVLEQADQLLNQRNNFEFRTCQSLQYARKYRPRACCRSSDYNIGRREQDCNPKHG